jgi:hypothetical protein
MATDTADKTKKGTINVSTENIFPIIKKIPLLGSRDFSTRIGSQRY